MPAQFKDAPGIPSPIKKIHHSLGNTRLVPPPPHSVTVWLQVSFGVCGHRQPSLRVLTFSASPCHLIVLVEVRTCHTTWSFGPDSLVML